MCGIAGIWDTSGAPLQQEAIGRMQNTLNHRGPDDSGIYAISSISLAHTRLSIIDVTRAGSQPFISSDSRYVLVFNGEIYNYNELREQHFSTEKFRSNSDTEVLLMMLIRFGVDALQYLRGMFAFAFFDTQEHKMILACDAFGKKPLFYAWNARIFLFASEPKALFASGQIESKLDTHAVAPYLLHEYCPSPASGFLNIFTLGAGQYMEISPLSQKIARWWTPKVLPKSNLTYSAALRTFDDLLGRAVERRMVADVPVGLFLSGGLDSSTIAWYMRNIKKDGEIHSCSVAFEDASFNEEYVASKVASDLRLTHHSITFTKDLFVSSLKELVPILDIPFADASLLPTFAVSKLARQHMKVVLDGDGSDELLGGYGTFSAYEIAERMKWIPAQFWRGVSSIADTVLPVSHSYFSTDFKIKSFLKGLAYQRERSLQVWLGAFTEREINLLFVKKSETLVRSVFDAVDSTVPNNIHETFDRASLYHIQTYLHRDILVKLDRATMAVGLEARTPFLDTDLAEFVLRLPSSYKRNKRILRELMQGRLPDIVLSRKKQGFGIPISRWFAEDLLSFVQEVLSEKNIQHTGIFRYEYIKELIDEHKNKRFDNRKKLWTLIVFQLWYERWIVRGV
ncbi:MAG: asparagine synthase (glutamine-hydrolyzing) [bacterium]|nr:asparagine synthase (glutamine-hydrolyzing) [bacterium]